MANRILYVPWQSVESIQHYASRQGVPTTEDEFGNLVFDLAKTRGHAPWSYLTQALVDHEVTNPSRYPNENLNDFNDRKVKMESAVAKGVFPGNEYHSKNTAWKKAEAVKKPAPNKPNKDWYEVWYTGRISPIILSLRADDQIYIRGHGLPGDTAIHSSVWKLTAKEVAQRLMTSGLQPNFAGKIKCYNCHSADSGIGTAFAQALANYLYTWGYQSCTYYGYLGSLDSFPGANDTKPDKDKNTQVQPSSGHAFKTSLHGSGLIDRARDMRQQITPCKLTKADL